MSLNTAHASGGVLIFAGERFVEVGGSVDNFNIVSECWKDDFYSSIFTF